MDFKRLIGALMIDFNNLTIQIGIVFVSIVVLWLLLKALKIIWKLLFIVLIFLALSFALPAVRQWILGFF